MNQDISFGQIVKERRTVLGLTQAELARRVGCAAITIRKIEADALRPSVQVAELLAIALGIPEKDQLGFIRLARDGQGPGGMRVKNLLIPPRPKSTSSSMIMALN